ncbi:DUF2809 domain-containing protein [Pontibacter chitinilyticus]|uniref:ribosomal maturation YjgA family protein n=1 Tax=Pontibacter chitinilyticus TaxID=2674989 RepID=UPI00321A1F18
MCYQAVCQQFNLLLPNYTLNPAKRTIKYLLLLLVVITAGLLSRKITGVPLMTGDVLYAMLVFVLVSYFFRSGKTFGIALSSMLICYSIEISQLCRAPWLVAIRRTTLGKLVLGQGFLWSDMGACTLGVLLCLTVLYLVNKYKQRHKKRRHKVV